MVNVSLSWDEIHRYAAYNDLGGLLPDRYAAERIESLIKREYILVAAEVTLEEIRRVKPGLEAKMAAQPDLFETLRKRVNGQESQADTIILRPRVTRLPDIPAPRPYDYSNDWRGLYGCLLEVEKIVELMAKDGPPVQEAMGSYMMGAYAALQRAGRTKNPI
ncbi:MAG TPA: hypothetical protein VJA23_01435 [Candidatus Nanoarchaeia archaeon]|nr:hypothetical protein [Candidatus Nanoarchaeia archaeon]